MEDRNSSGGIVECIVKHKGEYIGIREARKHIAWYTRGMKGSSVIRNEVCKTDSYEKMISIIDEYGDFIKGNNI